MLLSIASSYFQFTKHFPKILFTDLKGVIFILDLRLNGGSEKLFAPGDSGRELKLKPRSQGPENLILLGPPNKMPHNKKARGEGASPTTQSRQVPEEWLCMDSRWRPSTQ